MTFPLRWLINSHLASKKGHVIHGLSSLAKLIDFTAVEKLLNDLDTQQLNAGSVPILGAPLAD